MTFDIQYVAVLWVVSFQVFFYLRNDSHHNFIPVSFLKSFHPPKGFYVWVVTVFFSKQKQTYTSMQTFSHFFKVHFPRCKKIMSFSFSMFERYKVVRSSEQTAWEGTPQDVGQINTNTVTDYLCWLCVFFVTSPTWALRACATVRLWMTEKCTRCTRPAPADMADGWLF